MSNSAVDDAEWFPLTEIILEEASFGASQLGWATVRALLGLLFPCPVLSMQMVRLSSNECLDLRVPPQGRDHNEDAVTQDRRGECRNHDLDVLSAHRLLHIITMTSPASPFARASPMAHTPSGLRTAAGGSGAAPSPALSLPRAGPSGSTLRPPLGTCTPAPSASASGLGSLRPPPLGTRAGSVQSASLAPTSTSVQVGPADVERGIEVLLRERLGRLERMIEETCWAMWAENNARGWQRELIVAFCRDHAFDPRQDPALAEGERCRPSLYHAKPTKSPCPQSNTPSSSPTSKTRSPSSSAQGLARSPCAPCLTP